VILWIIAVVSLISDPFVLLQYRSQAEGQSPGVIQQLLSWTTTFRAIQASILIFVDLGAAAVLIELVDGLRWLATPTEARATFGDTYLISRWRRSRVF
jgi:hypothetical protein